MASMADEIAAFEASKARLESQYLGKWVLFHDRALVGLFQSFDAAADVAVAKFNSGPFLIRQLGAAAIPLPVSLAVIRPSAEG